jgi:hypothetical protein
MRQLARIASWRELLPDQYIFFFFFFFKFQIILFKNPAILLPYVAQGSYIGAPVVYIAHLTRENIKLSKKNTLPFIHKMKITNIHVHLI